jgi:hypothetical protein
VQGKAKDGLRIGEGMGHGAWSERQKGEKSKKWKIKFLPA